MIPCVLVGALESGGSGSPGQSGGQSYGTEGSGTTTIKALVDEDIKTWDTKQVIIPKGTQCNAIGHFERGRDRVFVNTDFTFILPGKGPRRVPLELVLPGIAQDREYNAQLDTWGVTDLSDGIRGDYIQTRSWDELLLFTASLLSGVNNSLSATSPSAFGQAYSNGSQSAATGLPGYAINPAVGGVQAVLNQEAARISQRIAQDGFFLRVPAHKQFYVLVKRGYSLRDALPSGEAQALRERHEEDQLRVRDERRSRARAADSGGYNSVANTATQPVPRGTELPDLAALYRAQAASALRQPAPLSGSPRFLATPAPGASPDSPEQDPDSLPAP